MKGIKSIILSILVFATMQTKAQVVKEWGLGIGAICNFTVPSYGAELRGIFILSDHWAIAPQVQYYPSFNRFHDLYLGTSLHFNFTPSYYWGLYALGHFSYHNWINYYESNNYKAKQHNWDGEPGIGIIKNWGCVRPYAEARYNIKWKEGNLRVGLAFFFGDCGRKHEVCPAYTYNN
jgi:hypothetical protein